MYPSNARTNATSQRHKIPGRSGKRSPNVKVFEADGVRAQLFADQQCRNKKATDDKENGNPKTPGSDKTQEHVSAVAKPRDSFAAMSNYDHAN